MNIIVNASRLNVEDDPTLSKEAVVKYAKAKVSKALSIFGAKETTVEIRLKTEGEFGRVVQKVEVVANVGGKKFSQAAHSRNIYKTIDRASEDLRRQVQKHKTKRLEKRRQSSAKAKHEQLFRDKQMAIEALEE